MEVLCSYIVEADWLLLVTCVLMIIAATLLAFRGDIGIKPQGPNRSS
jgi:hypothetical protein